MGVVLRSLDFRANVLRAVVLRTVAIGVEFLKSIILLGQNSQVLQVLTILSTELLISAALRESGFLSDGLPDCGL